MTRNFCHTFGRLITTTALLISLFVLVSACDSGFDGLNTDKTRQTSLEASLELNEGWT